MARLGELLVANGLLTTDQVEQALRAQIMWGGRLGTNLIELGYLDLDALSTALGRQHRLPAALARHFEKSDPELQRRLDPDVAERYSVVPIRQSGPQKLLVYASIDVIDERGQAILASHLGVTVEQLVPSVAAELRIRYHLERAYRIPRDSRYLRARGKSVPPFPQFEIAPAAPEDTSDVGIALPARADTIEEPVAALPADTIEASVAPPVVEVGPPAPIDDEISEPDEAYADLAFLEEPEPAVEDDLEVPLESEPATRDRRKYVRTIADEPGTDSERQYVAKIAIRRVPAPINTLGATLGEATRAIRRGTDRDGVADLVVATLERFLPECRAAIVLVLRGDVAIGWKGFCRAGTLPEIAVPLDRTGLLPRVIQRGGTLRAPASDLGPIDQLLLGSLGGDGDLVIVPVSIADQIMCAIALVTTQDAPATTAESVAVAAGAAFARLMRDASR